MRNLYLFILINFPFVVYSQSYVGACESNKQAENCNTIDNVLIDASGDILVDWSIGGPGGSVQNSSLQIVSVWVQTNGIGPWMEQQGYANTCIQNIKEAGGGADNSSGTLTLTGSFNIDDEVYIFYDAWTNPNCAGSCCGWNSGSTDGAILPVVYSNISIENDDGAILKWTTSVEINNDFFAVERSQNGRIFEEIGIVKGSGNSKSEITYSYWDPKPFNGQSYYRIIQYDYEGSSHISDVLKLNYFDGFDHVYVDFNSQDLIIDNKFFNTRYIIYTINGKIISNGTLTEGKNRISSESIPKGIFIASLMGESTQNYKLFKF